MKRILITGSTDGIGQLLAQKLASEGHHVYLHGRNADKLNKVIESIKANTQNANMDGFVADFSDLDSVQRLSAQVTERAPKLDVLINNAGIFNTEQPLNANGQDVRFVVNYLAPYLLTHALLPVLKAANNARIINLSSAAQAPVSLAALEGNEQLGANAAYAQSKLALTMWSFELAKQLADDNLSVTAVNPGSLLNTKMVQQAYGHHWSSADKGVNILYDLALSDEYENVTGQYFDNDKGEIKGAFAPAHPDASDHHKIAKLITLTDRLLSAYQH